MTIHYHGTPITPNAVMYTTAGAFYCVSHARPDQIEIADRIAQGILLDNGAFTKKTQGRPTDWPAYYVWCERWLVRPTTLAIIPDVIDAGSQEQDALIREWPFGERGMPVWHMDEPIERLLRLLDEWPRVAIGSTGEYWQIGSPTWLRRMEEVFNAVAVRHRFTPYLHMLRGMQLCLPEFPFPFASLDSTDVAQNHNRPQNTAKGMVDRWDAAQCPAGWQVRAVQGELVA